MPSRRHFIKQLVWGLPASCLLPSFLISCKPEENLFASNAYEGDVAIIGAGVAGLHAASILAKHGAKISILEAGSDIGGRIKSQGLGIRGSVPQDQLLVAEPIELGAELIYGTNNAFYDNVRSFTPVIEKTPEPTEYLIDDSRVSLSQLKQEARYEKYQQILAKIKEHTGADMPIDTYILQLRAEEEAAAQGDQTSINNIRTIYSQATGILNADISAEFGLLPSDLSVQEYRSVEELKRHGSTRYRPKTDALYSAIATVYRDFIRGLRLNTEVQAINYEGEKVVISIRDEENLTVDKVIVTVPVTKIGDIAFTPELPEEKANALTRIRMGSCLKIFMRFRERFWGEGLGRLYLPYPFSYVMPHPKAKVLTLYTYGAEADSISNQGAEVFANVRTMLDMVFGDQLATRHLQDARIVSWTPERSESPFIPGAYSYVEAGSLSARSALAAPIGNKVFFAGEATHTQGHASTVHGAIETAYRAAYELINSK